MKSHLSVSDPLFTGEPVVIYRLVDPERGDCILLDQEAIEIDLQTVGQEQVSDLPVVPKPPDDLLTMAAMTTSNSLLTGSGVGCSDKATVNT